MTASSASTSVTRPPVPTTGAILIVDDEAMVTTSLSVLLRLDTPHSVQVFNHPTEALNALKSGALPQLPDVIVSDFLMPDMDGIAFLEHAQAICPEATTILLTGYADKESAIAAINRVGIYRYLEKPWDNEAFKTTVNQAVERTLLRRTLHEKMTALEASQNALAELNRNLEGLVSERTQALAQASEQLQWLFDSSADGLMQVDEAGGIVSANAAARHLLHQCLGWSLSADTMHQLADWMTTPQLETLFSQASAHAPGHLEVLLGERTLELVASPLRAGFSSDVLPYAPKQDSVNTKFSAIPQGWVVVVRDISKRKELERLREDFVSTLTHDMRTPLLAAIQTLGFFQDGTLGDLSTRQIDIVDMMLQSHRDLLGLVNALLDVYKYEAGQQKLVMSPLELHTLLDTITRELAALAINKQQTLTYTPDPEVITTTIVGDRQELRRVFTNLIGNAIHHTPEHGTIDLLLEVHNATQHAVITIIDTGRGIPEHDMPKLFQRFSQGTSKVRSSGTGLGLYLSRQIVEAHHGEIGVTSREGHGSRFFVRLPLAR